MPSPWCPFNLVPWCQCLVYLLLVWVLSKAPHFLPLRRASSSNCKAQCVVPCSDLKHILSELCSCIWCSIYEYWNLSPVVKVTFIVSDLGSTFKGHIKVYDWIDIKFKQLNSIKAAFMECFLCIGHRNEIFEEEKEHAGFYWVTTGIAMGHFNTFSAVRDMPMANPIFS